MNFMVLSDDGMSFAGYVGGDSRTAKPATAPSYSVFRKDRTKMFKTVKAAQVVADDLNTRNDTSRGRTWATREEV